MSKSTQDILNEFNEAIEYLLQADPQSNSKGKKVKEWFLSNFSVAGRVSVVNEAKQAGNRAKEQLSQRDAEHMVFVITDLQAFDRLKAASLRLSYKNLKTIMLIDASSSGAINITPILLLVNSSGNSAVEKFYNNAYTNLQIEKFEAYGDKQAKGEEEIEITDDDSYLLRVNSLLDDGYAGVIFTGSPGTSKSWYARQVALKLAGGEIPQVFFIQFHPGYQYEDFIESFVPNDKGGFELADKIFLRACALAKDNVDKDVVIVIDELSRTDVVRVFGEALTYIEKSNRNLEFQLSSGRYFSIPHNLLILCTMNPWDSGVDELDLAFERRFAKVKFEPDLTILRNELSKGDLSENMQRKVEQFFFMVSNHQNRLCRIGHAYFLKANNEESLARLWDNQLSFHFERTLKNNSEQLEEIKAAWNRIFE